MARRNRMISLDEAQSCNTQPKQPCQDCPFARSAIPNWLGGMTPEEYTRYAHSDARIDCHTLVGPQCAGAAIYRANVGKLCQDKSILRLPADRDGVFATPMEFLAHHQSRATVKQVRENILEDE